MIHHRTAAKTALLGLIAGAIAGCAGGVTQPAAPTAYLETEFAADATMVAEAEKPLVLRLEPADARTVSHVDIGGPGQDVVRVRYAQSVEETVRWEGSGKGVAELKDEQGQLIYRVSEGGEPFRGTIPAGLLTLTIKESEGGETGTLVVEPKLEATWSTRLIFWQPEGDDSQGGWRV